jgi:hypothetical protein
MKDYQLYHWEVFLSEKNADEQEFLRFSWQRTLSLSGCCWLVSVQTPIGSKGILKNYHKND